MVSLIVAAALAQDEMEALDVACMPLQVTHTVPEADATNVPVDASFQLVLEGDCGGSTAWTLSITNPADDAVLASATWNWGGELPALATLDPEGDLPADTALVLHAVGSEGWYEEVMIPFTTGSGRVQGTTGALTAEIVAATYHRDSNWLDVTVEVTPAADPDGLSLVRLRGEGGGHQIFAAADLATFTPNLGWSLPDAPADICVDVSQIDGRGVESAPVEACSEVEAVGGPFGNGGSGGGCFRRSDTPLPAEARPATTEPAEPAQAALFLGGLVFLLRRRSR